LDILYKLDLGTIANSLCVYSGWELWFVFLYFIHNQPKTCSRR